MMRRLAPLALALVACLPESAEVSVSAPGAPELEGCEISAELAAEADAAIALWSEAAGTPIPLPLRIELADFGADTEHAGGWSARLGIIQISSRTEPAKRAASIAHELGHSLGLEHEPGTGELMDPDRPTAARLHPCISAATAAAAGFAGPGACAEL